MITLAEKKAIMDRANKLIEEQAVIAAGLEAVSPEDADYLRRMRDKLIRYQAELAALRLANTRPIQINVGPQGIEMPKIIPRGPQA